MENMEIKCAVGVGNICCMFLEIISFNWKCFDVLILQLNFFVYT